MLSLFRRPKSGPEQQLRNARALASRGRYREAVELARTSDHERSGAQLQRDLMRWRHEAFYAIEPQGPSPAWPPERSIDPRPDLIDQIPEIEASTLHAEVLGGALLNHGSLILRGLLSAELAESLRVDVDRAYDARSSNIVDAEQSWYAPFATERDPELAMGRGLAGSTSMLMADSPRFFARWVDVLRESVALRTVADYLGEKPVLSAKKTTMYRVPPDSGTQWHQDGAFLGGEKIRTVNLWVALTACGEDAPGLDIVPWRLPTIVPTGTHGSIFNWSVGDRKVEELASGRPLASPRFAPGDAMLFDHLCLHRTGVRAGMTRNRYALETWMFAPSTYPDGAALVL